MNYRLAFFSFADIDNFGDILFSHIFQMEMEKRLPNINIDFYTPSNFSVEGIDYISYSKDKIIANKYDALIVFGGEVIHLFDDRTWKPIYTKNNKKLESSLPSDVIYDWVDIDGPFKAWVSVGVRPFENKSDFLKTLAAMEELDYISVRGSLSKKILEGNDLTINNPNIQITPDMGWLFPDLLVYKNVKGAHYVKYIDHDEYLVFQINNINELEAKQIASYLTEFQTTNGVPVYLLPIIRPWEDAKYLTMILEQSRGSLRLLPNNLSILEIADILVHAKLILSSSLHAAITGLSAGVPSGIINKWQGTKLQDLFGHQFRLHALKHNLDQVPKLLNDLQEERRDNTEDLIMYAKFMKSKLGKLFDDLTERIRDVRK